MILIVIFVGCLISLQENDVKYNGKDSNAFFGHDFFVSCRVFFFQLFSDF